MGLFNALADTFMPRRFRRAHLSDDCLVLGRWRFPLYTLRDTLPPTGDDGLYLVRLWENRRFLGLHDPTTKKWTGELTEESHYLTAELQLGISELSEIDEMELVEALDLPVYDRYVEDDSDYAMRRPYTIHTNNPTQPRYWTATHFDGDAPLFFDIHNLPMFHDPQKMQAAASLFDAATFRVVYRWSTVPNVFAYQVTLRNGWTVDYFLDAAYMENARYKPNSWKWNPHTKTTTSFPLIPVSFPHAWMTEAEHTATLLDII